MEKNWNITMIESLTADEAASMAEDGEFVKGHEIYFVDFGGYFGYSMLVYLNDAYLYYANDYELHHSNHKGDKEWLHKYFLEKANRTLFKESEFATVLDYDDYRRKSDYLHNHYSMQAKQRRSIFACNPTDEEKAAFKRETEGWTYDPIGFCYIPDKAFVEHHIDLMNQLNNAKDKRNEDFEYWVSAFKAEMWNHEYAINWQGDWDTLSAFGNIRWHDGDLKAYFAELGFTETQKSAYYTARAEYFDEVRQMESAG